MLELTAKNLARHSLRDRLVHWLNAALWIFLVLTGFAMVESPQFTLFGQGFSQFMVNLFGSKSTMLAWHIEAGLAWLVLLTATVLANRRSVRVFFKEIYRIQPGDGTWLLRKPFQMLLGKKLCARWGLATTMPAQGFYNIGQKAFGVLSLLCGATLIVSGFVLALAAYVHAELSPTVLATCIALHYLAAGLNLAGLFIHIYMAALAPEERPGLVSMFTGTVPLPYAASHHALWLEEEPTLCPPAQQESSPTL